MPLRSRAGDGLSSQPAAIGPRVTRTTGMPASCNALRSAGRDNRRPCRIIRLSHERDMGLEVLAETCAAPEPAGTAEEVDAIPAINS
jgi:hypothetical protein